MLGVCVSRGGVNCYYLSIYKQHAAAVVIYFWCKFIPKFFFSFTEIVSVNFFYDLLLFSEIAFGNHLCRGQIYQTMLMPMESKLL